MITSLLIANRGEIACRIIRTAREMGIRTVAVYSDADAKALHVRQADEAVHIGASPARESYLDGDKIIAAAKASVAEAIHPGYGFLSENADFAQAVIDAGLVWVGPKPDSIRAMGLKDAAKTLMSAAGVPVTPGYIGDDQSPERLQKEADAIGYPVLIKAVAGGGGKGMRRVDAAADFQDALESCKREAASSFGNDIVLLEKYILSPRHIEVQVFGDSQGNVVHLFERDCSLQRRHQKVIEEAPAPGMDEVTRAAICDAAVKAAKAVDYAGAGTIEFIADASEGLRADRIWFMEMNTRLQVEHPVTEEITGVDLVEWQLRVASGEKLPLEQEELSINGWAIEARLYAEDPANGFLPSVGRLDRFSVAYVDPNIDWSTGGVKINPPSARVETGVEQGSDVSPFYDPMIAKLIVHADRREWAISGLANVCDDVQIWPVRTNASFLAKALCHPEFASATIDTGFIDRNSDLLVSRPEPSPRLASKAATILPQMRSSGIQRDFRIGNGFDGFRLNGDKSTVATIYIEGRPVVATTAIEDDGWLDEIKDWSDDAQELVLFEAGEAFRASLGFRPTAAGHGAGDGAILSPMPGKVTSVEVAAGDAVTKGQRLLTLEAMKMEHGLVAPFDGVVAELNTSEGAQVQVDAVLVKIEKQ